MSAALFDAAVPFRATFDGAEYQRARVVRVVDGDTADVVLDLGHDVTLTRALRVADLYCAERFRGTPDERARGEAAWHAGERLLPPGDTVYVRTEKTARGAERETLGRLVAHVRFRNGDGWRDYAATMRALGHDGQGAGVAPQGGQP